VDGRALHGVHAVLGNGLDIKNITVNAIGKPNLLKVIAPIRLACATVRISLNNSFNLKRASLD
jgi:hypothetical protein